MYPNEDINKVKTVTVMPCYDKKLEAVRPDFIPQVKEVDTVLATHELLELFEKNKVDFANVEPWAK